jgi:hypothetical protein
VNARIAVISVVASLAFAASAGAECAWVLWQQTRVWQARPPAADVWDIHGVFEKKAECDTALEALQRIDAKITDGKIPRSDPHARGTLAVRHVCYPDSIDSRGPKTK